MEVDKVDNMVANEVDDMVAKIRNKDFTDVTLIKVVILMEMMLEVVMGAVYMEVDKVTDKVADMVVDMEVDREAEEEVADMVMDNCPLDMDRDRSRHVPFGPPEDRAVSQLCDVFTKSLFWPDV